METKRIKLPDYVKDERRRTIRWWRSRGYSYQQIAEAFSGLTKNQVYRIVQEDSKKHEGGDGMT